MQIIDERHAELLLEVSETMPGLEPAVPIDCDRQE